jgi:hypothetical protein
MCDHSVMVVFVLAKLPRWWLWPRGMEEQVAFKALGNDAGFVLEVEGNKVIALKLPSKTAKELAGQSTSIGTLARLLSKLNRQSDEAGQEWLVVTGVQNPLLEDYDRFAGLVAQELTKASGTIVPLSTLIISAGSAVTRRTEKQYTVPAVAHLESQVTA